MGRQALCYILLISALQYIGSASNLKCADKYAECGVMSAAGGCSAGGEWGNFVSTSCPTSCGAAGCELSPLKAGADDFFAKIAASNGECGLESLKTKDTKDNKECKNWCPECIQWADEGECTRSYVWDKCRLACDETCNNTCIDVCPEACESWKEEGRCGDDWILERCQKSCNPDCYSTTPVPTTIDCTDDCVPACAEWAADKSFDMCSNNRFAKACPSYCDPRCAGPITTSSPDPATCDCGGGQFGQCEIKGDCTKWCHVSNWKGVVKDCAACTAAQDPLCPKYGNKLLFNPKTKQCGWPRDVTPLRDDCPGGNPTPNPPTAPTAPTDSPANCDEICHGQQFGQFKIKGHCTKWCHCSNGKGYVKDCAACTGDQDPGCPKYGNKLLFNPESRQCGWPRDVTPLRDDCPAQVAESKRAADLYADCKFWAANKDCSWSPNCGTCDWQSWVCTNCPSSCAGTNCENSKPNPPDTDDEYDDCKFWAANGDCADNGTCGTCDWQKWVKAHCKTSCP